MSDLKIAKLWRQHSACLIEGILPGCSTEQQHSVYNVYRLLGTKGFHPAEDKWIKGYKSYLGLEDYTRYWYWELVDYTWIPGTGGLYEIWKPGTSELYEILIPGTSWQYKIWTPGNGRLYEISIPGTSGWLYAVDTRTLYYSHYTAGWPGRKFIQKTMHT